MWQTEVFGMQLFPQSCPVVQTGSALAVDAKAKAAAAASSRVRMGFPP